MARTRRQFSAEFKREAVPAAKRPGSSVAQVAKELVTRMLFNRVARKSV